MSNPVAVLRGVNDKGDIYKGIFLWCPGCEYTSENGQKVGGLHLLPIGGNTKKRPTWEWNGDLVRVTLNPSILTKINRQKPFVCHSFLRDGRWQFLGDCTHSLANKVIPMSPLPDWVVR